MKSLNFAHRGFSGNYPENTMIAFKKALEAGAEGIEMDVQLTSDGEVVVFHDDTLDRLTNGSGFLMDHSLAELNQLSFDSDEQEGAQTQKIPTFEEYLKWVNTTDLMTNIELKATTGEDKGLEKKVIEQLRSFNCMDRIVFSSFHEESLARIKQLSADAKTGLLVANFQEKDVQKAYEMGIDCIHPRISALNEVVVEHIHKMGLEINAWTINLESNIQKALDYGIDGIITDYPDRVKRLKNSEFVK